METGQNNQNAKNLPEKPFTHATPDIKITIPNSQNSQPNNSETADIAVAMLPLESARIVTMGQKKKRISSEVKFIHLPLENRQVSPFSLHRVKKIKNLVYRNKIDKRISQEKTRLAALEETMMFERERRLNKLDCFKKMQRTASPHHSKERHNKKFKRTQDKKPEEQKKFKRIKEKGQTAVDEQKMIQAKLVKKMREELEGQDISRIPEHFEESMSSSMEQELLINADGPMVFFQSLEESLLLPSEEGKKSNAEQEKVNKTKQQSGQTIQNKDENGNKAQPKEV